MARQPKKPVSLDEGKKRLFSTKPVEFAMQQPSRNPKVSSSALRKISDEDRVIRSRRRLMSKTDRTWQQKSMDFAIEVGELGAVLNLQANTVSLCSFPVRKWSKEQASWLANDPAIDDKDETDDDYDDRPSNVMRAFVGPQGGMEDLVRRCAWNLYCTGEAHLCGTNDENQDLVWEFLSVDEVYVDAEGKLMRKRANFTEAVPMDDESYTARIWRSSPRYSDLADSEVRRVLPILQEIVTLTQVVDAIAKSRIPANLIYIPDDLQVMGATPLDDSDPDVEDGEPDFVDELFEHMTAPLLDPTSASRVMPLAITGPRREGGSGIEIIVLARDLDALSLQSLRQEALGRLAAGLDAPPEIVSGKSTANHWTAANIDAEFIVKHIQPIGQLIADFITNSYLRPMLMAFEGMSEEEAAGFKVEFDPSPVIARNDEAKSARDLADWLSDEAILTANGFSKADLASKDTIRQRRLWQLVSTQPAVYAKLLPLISGMEDVDAEQIGQVGTPLDNETTENDPVAPDETVPATGSEEPANVDEAVVASMMVERLTTAADAALGRAMERAGNRIVNLAKTKNPILRDRVKHVRATQVMSMVTAGELTEFSLTPKVLLKDAWDELSIQTRAWMSDYLEGVGFEPRDAADRASFAAFRLAEDMQQYAEDNLLRDIRPVNGLRVPQAMVAGIVEQAVLAPVGV